MKRIERSGYDFESVMTVIAVVAVYLFVVALVWTGSIGAVVVLAHRGRTVVASIAAGVLGILDTVATVAGFSLVRELV